MSGSGACRDNLDSWIDDLPDEQPSTEQPASAAGIKAMERIEQALQPQTAQWLADADSNAEHDYEQQPAAAGSECIDHPWQDCPKCGIGICNEHVVAFLNHQPHEPPALAAQETGEDGSRRYLKSELAYALAEVQSLSAERERLREVNQKLVEALQFIKAFFNRLEHDGDEDDPLTAARQRFHAPVHAAIDAALNEQGKESG